jgi:hypothetical protein
MYVSEVWWYLYPMYILRVVLAEQYYNSIHPFILSETGVPLSPPTPRANVGPRTPPHALAKCATTSDASTPNWVRFMTSEEPTYIRRRARGSPLLSAMTSRYEYEPFNPLLPPAHGLHNICLLSVECVGRLTPSAGTPSSQLAVVVLDSRQVHY